MADNGINHKLSHFVVPTGVFPDMLPLLEPFNTISGMRHMAINVEIYSFQY